MARLTHTINGTSFAILDRTTGRKSLGCFTSSANQSIIRFHPAGVDGNALMWCGRQGQSIYARMRYVGTASEILGLFHTDRLAWEQQSVTVVDSNGDTYYRCTLEPGSYRIASPPRACGTNLAYLDAEAIFNRES